MNTFSDLTPEEQSRIQYVVCSGVGPSPYDDILKCECDAGCGRKLMYRADVPAVVPKVCAYCADWLSNCAGEA